MYSCHASPWDVLTPFRNKEIRRSIRARSSFVRGGDFDRVFGARFEGTQPIGKLVARTNWRNLVSNAWPFREYEFERGDRGYVWVPALLLPWSHCRSSSYGMDCQFHWGHWLWKSMYNSYIREWQFKIITVKTLYYRHWMLNTWPSSGPTVIHDCNTYM